MNIQKTVLTFFSGLVCSDEKSAVNFRLLNSICGGCFAIVVNYINVENKETMPKKD